MKIIITESQLKTLQELSPKSTGIEEFIIKVKETPGLLKHLGFSSMKSLHDYLQDGDYEDFDELRKDAKKFKTEK